MLHRHVLILAAALAFAPPALAQTSPAAAPAAEASASESTQPTLTPKQKEKIKALAGPADETSGMRLSAGATLPPNVELREIPDEAELGHYRVAVVGAQVALVDPDTRSIIEVLQ